MRRIGTEAWAGIAMLFVSITVASPVLFGVATPEIGRGWWVAMFITHLVTLLASAVTVPSGDHVAEEDSTLARGFSAASRASPVLFGLGIVTSWAIVLTVPGMGLLLIVLVITAAVSVLVVPLWVTTVLIALNTVVVAISMLMSVPSGQQTSLVEVTLTAGFYALIQSASVLSMVTLIRERRLRHGLAQAHVELRAASVDRAEAARSAERLRISRDLHDLIGHRLTVLVLELETARHVDDAAAREHLERADGVARDLLQSVRATVGQLRAEPLDLERTLREITHHLPGLDVRIEVSPDVRADEAQTVVLVRATQELVTNTIRHSDARTLWIDLDIEGADTVLRAHDDGDGMRRAATASRAARTPATVARAGGRAGDDRGNGNDGGDRHRHSLSNGHGLTGLRERFGELGGEVVIDPGAGFHVTARMPTS